MDHPQGQAGKYCSIKIVTTKVKKTLLFANAFLFFLHTSLFAEAPDLERAADYKSNMPVRIVKEFSLPKGYHEGLYFSGENIWVSNGKGGVTWVVDPHTGKVTQEIKPVGTFTEGVTSAGDDTFWVTDWEQKKLYRVKIEENKMIEDYEISLEPSNPTGVVWTGKNLYLITWTRSLGGTKYHLMQLGKDERLFRKMQIKRIHEPAHLAWDGKHLWVTSWYSQRVYKIDVDTFSVLGSFKSPAKETTGIAWDGKYLWLTGSHAGLYQVEVLEK